LRYAAVVAGKGESVLTKLEAVWPWLPAGLAVVASGVVLVTLPVPWRRRALALVGVGIAAAVYRSAVPGVVLLHAAVFLVAAWLGRLPVGEPGTTGLRLVVARVAMVLLAVGAYAGRAAGVTAWRFPFAGLEWAPIYLDVLMFARLEALLWELGVGRVVRVTPGEMLTWSALPFTLMGPLLRFSDWQRQSEAGAPGAGDLLAAARVGLLGAAQVAGVVAMAALHAALMPAAGVRLPLVLRMAEWFGFGPWSFYLGASGYANLAVAAAACVGIRVPPMFDRPFGRPNLSAFWAHWNIPVTFFVRDVLFYQRWGFGRGDVYLSVVAIFLVIGLWHSGHPYWAIWGLLHGAGFCVYVAYTRRLRAGDVFAVRMQAVVPGRVLTYVFVCGAWMAPPQILRIVARL